MKKQNIVLIAAVSLLVLFGAATLLVRQQRAEQINFMASEQAHLFAPEDAVSYGAADARVVITEFFDPACETCAQLYQPVKKLVDNNPGQVRLVLRHAPFHANADQVVAMLLAAREQGLYWQALELTFATQSRWTRHHVAQPEVLWEFFPIAKVDTDKAKERVASAAYDEAIARELADAEALGVTKTPEYFVNGKPLPSWGYQQLVALVDAELAQQYP